MAETSSKQVSKVQKFWNAFQTCLEENRVQHDRSAHYVRWAQDFVRFLPGKRLCDQSGPDIEAFLVGLRKRFGVGD
jgi:hypothetical protein